MRDVLFYSDRVFLAIYAGVKLSREFFSLVDLLGRGAWGSG